MRDMGREIASWYDDPLLQPWLYNITMVDDLFLDAEWKQALVEKLKKTTDYEEWPRDNVRDSAVLVPIVSVESTPSILFTVRSHNLSRHRNEVR